MYPELFLSSLITALITIVIIVISIYVPLRHVLRRKNKLLTITIINLALIYLGTFITAQLLFRFFEYFEFVFAAPFFLVSNVAVIIIGGLFISRFYSRHILSGLGSQVIPNYSSPAVLRDAVSKILDSEHFLTALRSSLPRMKDDERFGLDFVPYMLNSIDERRRRAAKSARFFLLTTLFSALLFSGVVIYFGYILVNEASAGTPKTLAEIRDSLESASAALRITIPNYYDNRRFQQEVTPLLERLVRLDAGEKNKQVQGKVETIISEAKRTHNFALLSRNLSQAQSEVSSDGIQEKAYSTALEAAVSGVSNFINAQSIAIPELAERVQELRVLIPKAEDSLNKPENRIPEIIKRLALGLAIATFFLALLRYMGNLYRTRYQQVLAAESDDFLVRRFYIGYKSSMHSDEQRKAVLSAFIGTSNLSSGADSKDTSADGSRQEYELLKELLAALSKKL